MRLRPPRALLFDWDNTLVDTWSVIHHALMATLNPAGAFFWLRLVHAWPIVCPAASTSASKAARFSGLASNQFATWRRVTSRAWPGVIGYVFQIPPTNSSSWKTRLDDDAQKGQSATASSVNTAPFQGIASRL